MTDYIKLTKNHLVHWEVGTNLQLPKLLLLIMIIAAVKMIMSTKNRLFSFVKTVTNRQFAYSICYMQSNWPVYVP